MIAVNESHKKTAAEILGELKRVRGLLAERQAEQPADIPLLDDVVYRAVAAAAVPHVTTPAPPSEDELNALIETLIDREMPRIRLELKRALRDELRTRELLK